MQASYTASFRGRGEDTHSIMDKDIITNLVNLAKKITETRSHLREEQGSKGLGTLHEALLN